MFTNKTENLDLPQWVGTDKANWDIDLNYAFKQISDYVTTLNEKFGNIEYTENDIKNDIQTINNNISSINTVLDSLNEVTTNHSSEISSLKEKVTKLQSDVSSLTTDFSESSADLTQRIQTIENDLPSIEQSITTLTQNYNDLNTKVNKATFYKSTINGVIGDNKISDDKPINCFLIIPHYKSFRETTEDIVTDYNIPLVFSVGREFTPSKKKVGNIIVNTTSGNINITVSAQMDVGSGGVYRNFRLILDGNKLPDSGIAFTVLKA